MTENRGLVSLYVALLLVLIILSYMVIYLENIIMLYDLTSLSIICDEFIIETKSFSASLARLTLLSIIQRARNGTLTIESLLQLRNLVESQVYKVYSYLIKNFPRRLNFSVEIFKISISEYNYHNIHGFFNKIAYYNVFTQNTISSEFRYCTVVEIGIKYELLIKNKLYLKRSDNVEIIVPIRYYLIRKILNKIDKEISNKDVSNMSVVVDKVKTIVCSKYDYLEVNIVLMRNKIKIENKNENITIIIKIIVNDYFLGALLNDKNIKIKYIAVLRKDYCLRPLSERY